MRNFGLIFAGLAAAIALALALTWSKGLKQGIDLSGGTILVYKVKTDSKAQSAGSQLDALITTLQKRINPEGVVDLPIRKAGTNRIEIILAKATPEEVERLKRKITDMGSLQFRILANRKHDDASIRRALASPLNQPPKGYAWIELGETITSTAGKLVDETHISDTTQNFTSDRFKKGTTITLVGKGADDREATRTIPVTGNTEDTITFARPHMLRSLTSYTLEYRTATDVHPSDDAIVRDEPVGKGRTDHYVLVKLDSYNVTGDYLARAYRTQDDRVQPAVGFVFNARGARLFGSLTGSHMPEEGGAFKYRLAVILDNAIRSAPSLNSRISESGIIEGVPPDEVQEIIEILQAGSLPATIDPTPELEENVGPTLGADTITKGLRAIFISMAVVPVFMITYYHFAGIISVIALIMNMILLVASMAVTDSSFTLPGMAGLALTIGMAVDANVLIFERMREERDRGASLAQQIHNGFARAWITIFDSHITIFLTGIVLWLVGTQEVKGFALTLVIGMIWNLFTAVWVSHAIFDFCLAKGILKKITMLKILDKTQIDFIKYRHWCLTISGLTIAIGMVITYVKYTNGQLLNIDFTGGTLVTIQLDEKSPEVQRLRTESQRSAFVRNRAEKALRDVSVETIHIGTDIAGERFNIRTTEDNVNDVQKKISQQFDKALARIKLTLSAPTAIPGTPAAETKKAETPGDAAKKAATPPAETSPENKFAGGTRFELRASRSLQPTTIQAAFTQVLKDAGINNPDRRFEVSVVPVPAAEKEKGEVLSQFAIKTDLPQAQAQKYLDEVVKSVVNDKSLLFDRLETFGGAVAGETRNLAVIAIVLSWFIMIAFLWFRFKSVAYGVGAVLSLIYDVLFSLTCVAISPYKIDLPMVAAFLTLIGFSANDTIVIFDRIREIKGKTPYLDPAVVNAAINQCLSRTILTTFTAWVVVFVMYIFGGEGLKGFTFCLVVGFLSGVYSTVGIASPVLVDWISLKPEGQKKPKVAVDQEV